MARRPPTPAIPLPLRAPNPPAAFVGRQQESERLTQLLARGPFAALVGPAGIGKTSLVLELLARSFPEARERAIFVAVPEDEPFDQVCRTLLHALAGLSGHEDTLDLPAIASDLSLTLAALLDLLQRTRAFVILDDVHHIVEGAAEDLLAPLATYARDARVVVTSRRALRHPALTERTVELSRLPDEALTALAHALTPLPSAETLALVPAAKGSPFVLKQIVARGSDGLRASREALVGDLSPRSVSLLETLALLRAPAGPELLAGLGDPSEAELSVLVGRGLLSVALGGVRLHDVVAELLVDGMPEAARDERARALRDRLLGTDDPGAWLEAVRLSIELHDPDAVHALLEDRGEGIVARGLAPRLFHALRRSSDPRIAGWQLRCAAELGNATALEALDRPNTEHATRPGERLAWARARYLSGEPATAVKLLRALAAEVPEAEGRAARLLWARAELADDHPSEALEILRELSPDLSSDRSSEVERAALHAMASARLGQPSVEALEAALASSASSAADAWVDAAEALMVLGHDERALALLGRVSATPRGASAAHLVGRRALLGRAELAISSGRLGAAAALLDVVRPYVRGASIFRVRLLRLDVARRLAMGELRDLDAVLGQAEALAQVADRASLAALGQLAAALAALRRRGPFPEGALGDAQRALANGDAATAERDATELHRKLRERRPLEALEALALACDAALVAAARPLHRELAARLVAAAEASGSPRWLREASFHEAPDDLGNLEQLAQDDEVAPGAAHRARALLGAERATLALDAIDHQVVDAVAGHIGRAVTALRSSEPSWSPGWGLDRASRRVWLPDGRWVDFDKKPLLFKLLAFVADARGESVGKEALALGVWGERLYDPRLHDAKLHVAVRALRKDLEDDPTQPARLVTTADGYALGGTCRATL